MRPDDDGPFIEAVPCHGSHVDIRDSRHPDSVMHLWPDEFATLVEGIKAGNWDSLLPPAAS